MTVCSVDDCESLVTKSPKYGFCTKHLRRWQRHGDPSVVGTRWPDRPPVERFWSHVDKSAGPDGCWLWTAHRDRANYGSFQETRQIRDYSHRYAWSLENGPIPVGMYICHQCDNPPCCNPAHLFMGTPTDNNLDMTAKGRHWMLQRDTCKQGHPWAEETTYWEASYRRCKICLDARRERVNRAAREARAERRVSG